MSRVVQVGGEPVMGGELGLREKPEKVVREGRVYLVVSFRPFVALAMYRRLEDRFTDLLRKLSSMCGVKGESGRGVLERVREQLTSRGDGGPCDKRSYMEHSLGATVLFREVLSILVETLTMDHSKTAYEIIFDIPSIIRVLSYSRVYEDVWRGSIRYRMNAKVAVEDVYMDGRDGAEEINEIIDMLPEADRGLYEKITSICKKYYHNCNKPPYLKGPWYIIELLELLTDRAAIIVDRLRYWREKHSEKIVEETITILDEISDISRTVEYEEEIILTVLKSKKVKEDTLRYWKKLRPRPA